jgi:hypothetical protein
MYYIDHNILRWYNMDKRKRVEDMAMPHVQTKALGTAIIPAKKKELSIAEIESYLGFDKVKPITLSPSDQKVKESEGEYFKEWYETELRRLYAESHK